MIEISDEHRAQELISIFVCKNDNDIENFLKDKAILFEKIGKSRTFLIYNEEEDTFTVLAYFSLALQILKIPEGLSNRQIKNLDGYNAKIKGERITELPAILVGQLGKNDLYKEAISGYEIMQYCLSTLLLGQERLGGRIIMLECKNVPYLIDFYGKFGFCKIEKDYDEDELIQFVRVLQENEIVRDTLEYTENEIL